MKAMCWTVKAMCSQSPTTPSRFDIIPLLNHAGYDFEKVKYRDVISCCQTHSYGEEQD